MNKSAIQKFAIQARRDLIEQVKQRAYQYGIDETGFGDINAVAVSGRVLSSAEKSQRQELIRQIQQKGYAQEMEEVAYTWFNRFIALRFMEVNNYLPSHIRVFSDAGGSFSPEILKDALHLDLPGLDKGRVAEYIESNNTDDLYRYLLLTQCNALNVALPGMFQRMSNYTEMLLPNNILRPDSVLGHMVADIPEEDWKDQVQIIGWIYQYYNTEPKQAVFDGLKKNIKITKDTIPAATQLFTPDWIVRYMVENSLGRLWTEGHPNAELRAGWKYYLDEADQEPEVEAQLAKIRKEYQAIKPEEIKVIDPCMGSGHILVYAFDVLMQIYQSAGWDQREAAQSILEHNLYGLDIDDRAAQLAYFAVMMKARQYDRRIFTRDIQPHVYAIQDSNGINRNHLKYMGDNIRDKAEWQRNYDELCYVVDFFRDAKEYGSILNPERHVDYGRLYEFRGNYLSSSINIETMGMEETSDALFGLIEQYAVLSQKYDVVVTNPPYMGASGMGAKLSEYVKKNYPDSKSDLFAVFIERCGAMAKKNGYQAMITQHAWMFLPRYEELRVKSLSRNLINMVHLGTRAFEEISGEVVQTVSFVFNNIRFANYLSTFVRLVDYPSEQEKASQLTNTHNWVLTHIKHFNDMPGHCYSYWASSNTLDAFVKDKTVADYGDARQGMATGNNELYVRYWYEPSYQSIGFDYSDYESFKKSPFKYVPYTKSAGLCRWYGNYYSVLKFDQTNYIQLSQSGNCLPSRQYYFRENANWSLISTGKFCARYAPRGSAFDVGAHAFFGNGNVFKMLGYINTTVFEHFIKFLSPTMNYNSGIVAKVPVRVLPKATEQLAEENVDYAKCYWDSFEASWDFKRHPLVRGGSVAEAYSAWEQECADRFSKLKSNEEELNRIFIDIYGLQDELTPEVEDKDVTVRLADKKRDIRSLISYAVGCMFGRYSLDVEGLAYAGGEWDASKYSTFPADRDNIIPICDDEYFDDDITGRFVQWVETVYGQDTLEENLRFIVDALGGKGSPREVIRSYFLNDFYADHLKVYQKRPIYWLFDSGKKNGFKALIYMHRYQRDLLARMRTDYVHEQQERYRTQLTQIGDALTHASGSEAVKLSKQQKKIQEQSLEIQKYEEKIHHLADRNIEIDLDDGVKHNYALFDDVLAKIK